MLNKMLSTIRQDTGTAFTPNIKANNMLRHSWPNHMSDKFVPLFNHEWYLNFRACATTTCHYLKQQVKPKRWMVLSSRWKVVFLQKNNPKYFQKFLQDALNVIKKTLRKLPSLWCCERWVIYANIHSVLEKW